MPRLVVVVVVACALVAAVFAGAAASASTAAAKRASSSAAHVKCSKPTSQRASRRCRRARASAGFKRTAGRRGRALLAPRSGRPAGSAGVAQPTTTLPAPASPAAPAGADPVTAPGGDPVAPVTSTIGAEAYDFGSFVLRLTKTAVPAGNLTIYFRNYDVSEHNLWIAPPAGAGAASLVSEAVGEGGGATKTVAITPGTWRLYCSITGHESMTRDLAVQ